MEVFLASAEKTVGARNSPQEAFRQYLREQDAFLRALHTGWKPMLHWLYGVWSDVSKSLALDR
jgi:hypothetical protein